MLTRRSHRLAPIAASLIWAPVVTAQSPPPLLVPFNTSFSHSDNHWIAWMPTHPIYEAIEVRSTPDPLSPNGVDVRVFLTERAGGKNQVHYFNTAAAAKAFRGQGFHRSINYTARGEPGGPVSLDVKFDDKDGRPVDLSLHSAPGQPMSDQHAGLTNQMGHNADILFLIFFREKAASAAQVQLMMDGKDYSITSANAASAEQLTRTGYRSNAFVVTFVYGQSQYDWKDGNLTNSWRRVFQPVNGPHPGQTYRSKVADGTIIEVVTNPASEMVEYRHLSGEHVIRLTFSPALPSVRSAKTGLRVRYEASIDNFGVQVQGTAVVQRSDDKIIIDWQHDSPAWTKGSHFQSTIQSGPNGYALDVRKSR